MMLSMEADRLAPLRDALDEYLQRCAVRGGPNPRAMRPLAIELISSYHDEIAHQCGEVPEQAARHLRNAGTAAQDNEPPIVARELDAALAVAERRIAGQGRRSADGDEGQETKGITPT